MSRILIVDDSPTQLERLRAVLEDGGYDVEPAGDAEAALTRFAADAFDLVITDILMPGMDGYELCRRIKSEERGRVTPVILLSTLNNPMDIILGLECGADNFVTKPYSPEQILGRLAHVLENHRLRSTSRIHLGVEVMFLGKRLTITSDKRQILDLLISTFEDIVRTNRHLQDSKASLAAAKAEIESYARELERRVEERTALLTEKQRQLAQAQAIARLGNWRWDVGSGRIAWSEEMSRILHLIPAVSETTLEEVLALIHPDDRDRTMEMLRSMIDTKRSCRFEFRIQRPNGSERQMASEGHCEFDADGAVAAVFGIFQDITERKTIEQALRESNQTLSALVSSSPFAIVSVDREGRISSWNRRAEEIFGYSAAEMSGSFGLSGLEIDGVRFQALLEQGLSGQALPGILVRIRHKDGRELDVELSGSPLYGDGIVRGVVLAMQDVTARRLLEQQLHQAQKMEAVGQLTGGVAHDFNNLLAVIVGNLDLVQERIEDDPDAAEMVDQALQATIRGAQLTKQLLAFSRKQALQPRVIDLNGIVRETASLLGRTLGATVHIQLDLMDGLWSATADPSQVETALTNLAINARAAMPNGGILTIETANATVDTNGIPEVEPGDYAVLAVSDTGTGIPPGILPRIFEPFFTTKDVGKGTGLGLSTVYGFAKQSGGAVKVYSEPGHGTTFKLFLPRASHPADGKEEAVQPIWKPSPGKETILVVEDDQALLHVVVGQISSLGYRVLEAASGDEALARLESEPGIDLLFTDVIMPGGMLGPELAERARSRLPGLRVLFTSGFSVASASTGFRISNRDHLLSKPYRKQDLAQKLRNVLDAPAPS